MAVRSGFGHSFWAGVSPTHAPGRAVRLSFDRGAALIAGFVLVVLSALATPAQALTCPDETVHSIANPAASPRWEIPLHVTAWPARERSGFRHACLFRPEVTCGHRSPSLGG